MTIYFTASFAGKKQFGNKYVVIVEELRKHGHTVVADHILRTTEERVSMETPEERQTFHKQLDQWISSSDCVVAETSLPSISVGFEISLALSRSKPVLVLYTKDSPTLLRHMNNEQLICEQYNDKTIHNILEDFLLFAQGSADHRFTFFISNNLGKYLAEQAKKTGMPKSAYLRQLLLKDKQQTNT